MYYQLDKLNANVLQCISAISFYVVCINQRLYGIVRKRADHTDTYSKTTYGASPRTAFEIIKVTDLFEAEPCFSTTLALGKVVEPN